MSHVHNIAGGLNAAAQHQEYLERMKAQREIEGRDAVRGKTTVRTFDSALESSEDENSESGAGRGGKGGSGGYPGAGTGSAGSVTGSSEVAPDSDSDSGSPGGSCHFYA